MATASLVVDAVLADAAQGPFHPAPAAQLDVAARRKGGLEVLRSLVTDSKILVQVLTIVVQITAWVPS